MGTDVLHGSMKRLFLAVFQTTSSYTWKPCSTYIPALRLVAARHSSSKRSLQTQTYSIPTTLPTETIHSNVGAIPPVTPAHENTSGPPPAPPKPSPLTRKMRPRKAAMSLTPTAVSQLKSLMDQPTPQLIRVGVKNRGCSGLAYHLEYIDKPAKFDEEVVQDGVRVLIDSKALFSIIGSEMDWVEDKLSARFVFTNPNIKDSCGCGESFSVG
ncbi:iron-sulfur cluster assembly accessory family protein [Geopyxis carbonaria]|nr:iron-sulfur cluster assembly accessory family protein [Geopyxis carbonaria]